MECPKCGNEIIDKRCPECGKTLIDVYFKIIEEKQRVRKYDQALEYLNEIRDLSDDSEILDEVNRIESAINLNNYDIKTGIDKDAGDSTIVNNRGGSKETLAYSSFKKMLVIAFIIIAIVGGYEFIRNKYYDNLEIKNTVIDNRKLDLTLLFHLNQGVNPNADIADRVSYNGLIRTLRKHPNLKFNLHVSGTLVQDLLWYNPETIDLIKEGVDKGQFEILGSTYAQNLLYSTDNVSNRWQMEKHSEIINRVFDVDPVGFWNPERTWSQDMASLLLDKGYKYTFVEDHILEDSGTEHPEHILRTTEDGKLMIINDDYDFLDYFNSAIDAGDNETLKEDRGPKLSKENKNYKKLYKYMRNVYKKDENDNFVLNYAEDGEATGLWDFQNQRNNKWDFQNLDFLLTQLENTEWIQLRNYSSLLNEEKLENITNIVDGAAKWMDDAAQGKGPYSEKGYTSWFDFNKNSPKLKYYGEQHKKYVNLILENQKEKNKAIENLNRLAKENLLAHQFEFGCTGISGTDVDWENGNRYGMWENVKLNMVIQEAIEAIKSDKEDIYIKDVNGDDIKEIVAIYNKDFYVFSKARGGRLLFWYDLEKGIEMVGGELGNQLGEKYYDLNYPIKEVKIGNKTRFLNGDSELLQYLSEKKYNVRKKAINEKLIYKEIENDFEYKITDIYKVEMDYSIPNKRTIVFKTENFIKVITLLDEGLKIDYKIDEKLDNILSSIKVISEVQPDYLSIVNRGKDILKVSKEKEGNNSSIKVYNEFSNVGIKISSPNFLKAEVDESLMGIIADIDINKATSFMRIEKYSINYKED